MALAVTQVYARSPYRLRVVFSGGDATTQTASAFALTRYDGGPCEITVSSLFAVDTGSLELTMSGALLVGVVYVLTWSASGTSFSYIAPASENTTLNSPADDPAAVAFGVDISWLFAEPTADGDAPRRTGFDCLYYDLPNRALLKKNELVQDPTAGGGVTVSIGGQNDLASAVRDAARVEADYRRDDRLADVRVDATTSSDGTAQLNAQVVPLATGVPLNLRSA